MNTNFDARTFAESYLDAWNRRDEAALRGTFFAPHATYRDIALQEMLGGIDAIIGFMKNLARTFPDVRWDVLDVIAESENRLAIQWMSRRTINGVMNETEGVSVMHRQDGRILLNTDFRHRGA
jgi:ketosteroid isomerase-like protein